MTMDPEQQADTHVEDDAAPDTGRGLATILRHPLTIGVITLIAAVVLFRFGVYIGGVVYRASDGDGMMAAVFGATIVLAIVIMIAVAVRFDRRRRARGDTTN